MRKFVVFRIGSKNSQLPRLIGSFLVAIAVLMLISSGGQMFDTWRSLKEYKYCADASGIIQSSNSFDPSETYSVDDLIAQERYSECRMSLYQTTGTQVPVGKFEVELWKSRQFWIAMLTPIASFFIWAIIFLIGLFFYNNPALVLPVESAEFEKRKRKR